MLPVSDMIKTSTQISDWSDALSHFKLDFSVALQGIYLQDGKILDFAKAVVKNDGSPLSVVGNRYVPMQPNALGPTANSIVKPLSGEYVNGGMLGGKLFVQARLKDVMRVKNVDEIQKYLTLQTSFDGSTPTVVGFSGVRIVCLNTFLAALDDAKRYVSIRHTATSEQRLEQAEETIKQAIGYFDTFQVKADWLADQKMNDSQTMQAIMGAFGTTGKDLKELSTRTVRRMEQVREIYESNTVNQFRGTAWGVYNALTEWADHTKTVRNDSLENRMDSILFGSGAQFKDRSLGVIEKVLSV